MHTTSMPAPMTDNDAWQALAEDTRLRAIWRSFLRLTVEELDKASADTEHSLESLLLAKRHRIERPQDFTPERIEEVAAYIRTADPDCWAQYQALLGGGSPSKARRMGNQPPAPRGWLTVQEAAALAGCAETTIHGWIVRGGRLLQRPIPPIPWAVLGRPRAPRRGDPGATGEWWQASLPRRASPRPRVETARRAGRSRMKRPRRAPRPDDPQDPPRVRRQQREGPTAVAKGEWRDPDDITPTAVRTARTIQGYRQFDPLRLMLHREGSSITERHVFAADRLRRAVDIAAIGLSGLRDLLPVTSLAYGPVSGPTKAASRQARASREVGRVWGLYTQGQRDMLIGVVIQNRTLASWCRERAKPIKPSPRDGNAGFLLGHARGTLCERNRCRHCTWANGGMILAIDPGIAGAFCLVGDTVQVGDLPVHAAQHGRAAKVRSELDLHALRELLVGQVVTHCFLEQVAARPGQGVTSMFRFGQSSGALYGLVVGLGLPVTFVRPQQWQKYHGIGASPDAARQRAVQLFPALTSMLSRKRDQHRADALLLAEYGRYLLAA